MFIQRSFYNLCRKRATYRSIPKHSFQRPYNFKTSSRMSNSATKVVEPSPSTIYPPFAKYAHAVVADMDSNIVFTSGQLGIAPDGSIPSSAYEQAKLCFQNIDIVLKESATKTENEFEIVRLNAFVSSRDYLQDYMKARDEYMGNKNDKALAASTLMIVSGFSKPEFHVEVEAIAAAAKAAAAATEPSAGINVQKRSYHTLSSTSKSSSLPRTTLERPSIDSTEKRSLHFLDQPRVELEAVQSAVQDLKESKPNIQVVCAWESEEASKEVAFKSRDYYWYSPILKPLLRGRKGDALIMAQTEEDVLAACLVASRHQVPLVIRGAGTGNYGQAVPLRGGLILDMSHMNQIEDFDTAQGILRVGAGARLQDIEDETRKHGWELRQHPSTRRLATIGGFIAGGSTGHGGLLHGGLGEDGAILGLRVVIGADDDSEPKVLELKGQDVAPVVHAYGTNGIITSVEIPLARAQPWSDVTVVFDSLSKAAEFSLKVANAPAVVKRAISVFQAPIPSQFLGDDEYLHADDVVFESEELGKNGDLRHVSIIQCALSSIGPIKNLADSCGGQITRTIDALDAPRPFYEFGWNHTTLHALKKDRSVTYLQAVMSPEQSMELVEKIQNEFGPNELLQHLEVLNFDGRMGFGSLALLWPQGDDEEGKNERLRQILKWHEDAGIAIFDPHTHILEDGGMKQTNYAQLGFKRRSDPKGIMNPGKMRAWEEQAVTDNSTEGNEAFSKAFRLAEGASDSTATKATEEKKATTMSRYWAEWTTADFSNHPNLDKTVAILPLGATEAHGPHLPLGVDSMHNKFLLDEALKKLPADVSVVALPPLEIGVSCEHSSFAGTLEISHETAAASWVDIGACVAKVGIRKLVLYNSHGGNQALAEVVARRLRLDHGMLCVLCMNLMQSNDDVTEMFPSDELRYGIHGGAVETSLMLHIRPDLVSMENASDFASKAMQQPPDAKFQYHGQGFNNKMGWLSQDLNASGVVGAAASQSDAQKGALLADACADNFAQLLKELYEIPSVDDIISSDVLFPPNPKKE